MTLIASAVETFLAPPVEYWVQCSARPNSKSEYLTRITTKSQSRAELYYRALNIGLGYRKRLVAFSPLWGTKVLARASS
jgi:hypothetical protein